jgi:hypothetical protein
MPSKPFTRASLALAAMAACATFNAHAVDIDAGDYTALPPGTTLGMVYYQHATRDSLYANGEQAPIRPRLTSDIAIARGVHFMKLGRSSCCPSGACRPRATSRPWAATPAWATSCWPPPCG